VKQMTKPYALLSFDPYEWDSGALSHELDMIQGVENWVLIFGNAFFLHKTVPAAKVIDALNKYRNGRSFMLIEFESPDANGILPADVAKEIRASLRSELTAA
jgi:hypothetical protein